MSWPALTLASVLGLIFGVLYLLDRWVEHGVWGRSRPQSARWARGRDLRDLRVSQHEPGRLILGRHGRRLLAAENRASVVVVGPSTVSFKTTGFAIPALLEWDGPVLATSVKSDLLQATIEARKSKGGEVMVFDPTQATGIESIKATPLLACGEWRGAMRVAHRLASSARTSGTSGLEDGEFWYGAAEKLLAPLLFAAARSGGQMADVIGWLNAGEGAKEEVSKKLVIAQSKEALGAWQANWNREERTRSSIYTTAETILSAFADPRVLKTSSKAEYTPAKLLDGKPNSLYLCAPANEQERLRTLFAAMISELVAVVYESAAQTGKPFDPPLLIVLDEAANVAPIPELDVLASTGAGQGIQLVTVFQDIAQVNARYGRRAQTIVNNHRAKVFASGIGDPDTLRYINEVVGQGEFQERRKTAGREGYSSSTEGSTYRELAPANVVRGARPGEALLVYGHLPPARLALRPWFSDPELTTLVRDRAE